MPNTWKMVQTPLRELFQEELQAYEAKFVVSKNWAQNRLYIKAKANKPVLKKSVPNSPLAPKNKASTNNFAKTLIVVDFCMAMLIGMTLHSAWVEPIQSGVVKANISPVTFTKEELEAFFAPRKAEAKAIKSSEKKAVTENEIEKARIIAEAFPNDPVLAIAVSMSEGFSDPKAENRGRARVLPNGKLYSGECSIGIFQINLKSDGCFGKKVHWDKVPGETLEEKITWLHDVKNNTSIAKIIAKDGTNWGAWSGFSTNRYKNRLEKARQLVESL